MPMHERIYTLSQVWDIAVFSWFLGWVMGTLVYVYLQSRRPKWPPAE